MKKTLSWDQHIERCDLINLSKKEYCVQNGISYAMFFYYRRKQKETISLSGFREIRLAQHQFTETSVSIQEHLKLQFSDGTVLLFPEHLIERVVGLMRNQS